MLGKIKASPPMNLVRHGLLYEAFKETSCGDYCYIFLKEEREGEDRKREEEVRRDRGKERRGEGKREGAWVLPTSQVIQLLNNSSPKVSYLERRDHCHLVTAALTIVHSSSVIHLRPEPPQVGFPAQVLQLKCRCL